MNDKTFSALIGLARCSDESPLKEESLLLICDCLIHPQEDLSVQLHQRKAIESPNCHVCPVQCNRHQDYDLSSRDEVSECRKSLDEQILLALSKQAEQIKKGICDKTISDEKIRKFVNVLFYLGENWMDCSFVQRAYDQYIEA